MVSWDSTRFIREDICCRRGRSRVQIDRHLDRHAFAKENSLPLVGITDAGGWFHQSQYTLEDNQLRLPRSSFTVVGGIDACPRISNSPKKARFGSNDAGGRKAGRSSRCPTSSKTGQLMCWGEAITLIAYRKYLGGNGLTS